MYLYICQTLIKFIIINCRFGMSSQCSGVALMFFYLSFPWLNPGFTPHLFSWFVSTWKMPGASFHPGDDHTLPLVLPRLQWGRRHAQEIWSLESSARPGPGRAPRAPIGLWVSPDFAMNLLMVGEFLGISANFWWMIMMITGKPSSTSISAHLDLLS